MIASRSRPSALSGACLLLSALLFLVACTPGGPTAWPTGSPTAGPTDDPSGPVPSARPTDGENPPSPSSRATPQVSGALTPDPTATRTADPSVTAGPSPSVDPTAGPSATQAPTPRPTPTRKPTPTPPVRTTRLLGVRNLRETGFVTGEDSVNRTLTHWTVGGTDLGVLFGDGPYYMAFGDTFASEGDFSAGWRSNTLAVIGTATSGTPPVFSSMITDGTPDWAEEVLSSLKRNGEEMTVIPTGGFQVGDVLYMTFMSVRSWGGPGEWWCNYGGLARSTDQGRTWQKLDGVRWPGDAGFVQNAALKVGDYVYFWGIPAGRFGDVSLMRVPQDRVEEYAAYEYFQGREPSGEPRYATGESALRSAAVLIPGPVGELSVVYNEYVEAYLLSYYCEGLYSCLLHASLEPEGPFDAPFDMTAGSGLFMIYGPFMHGDFVADGGRRIGFALSQWLPTYNVRWLELELIRRED